MLSTVALGLEAQALSRDFLRSGVTVAGNVREKSPARAMLADFWEVDQGREVLRSLFPLSSVPRDYHVAGNRRTTLKFDDGNWHRLEDDGGSRRKMGDKWTRA